MGIKLKESLINIFLETQDIDAAQLKEAMVVQKREGVGLDKVLMDQGLVAEKDFLMFIARELKLAFINFSEEDMDPSLQWILSEDLARKYHVMPLSMVGEKLTVVVSDPLDLFVIDDIKNATEKDINVAISTRELIGKAIEVYYHQDGEKVLVDFSQEIEECALEIISIQDNKESDIEGSIDESKTAPIVRIVKIILEEAVQKKASDIHIEPVLDNVRVRLRIDGILQDAYEFPKKNQNAILTRIKIMAHLNPTLVQTPQDGRFSEIVNDENVSFRVSALPTIYGQKIVIRILDKANLVTEIEGLGFSGRSLDIMKKSIKKPFGMLLVTGPTGSGKSTTLYSIIQALNDSKKNIITVEDPVEYQVDGLAQIQTQSSIGLTFAESLRSILRQSPDIVMVGEIRDYETADIAIKSSLTGQLVLSTLHTNDATGALTRLIDMGVEPFLVSSSIISVSAQRLCRKICKECKVEIKIPSAYLNTIKYSFKEGMKFYQGKGCSACGDVGYVGRCGVTEVLQVDDDIRDLLMSGKSSDEIKSFACREKGMKTLFEDAMAKCENEITSLEEVLRIAME